MTDLGLQMHALCTELFPICRSITGQGVRQTLAILQQHMPALRLFEVPSGTRCFDWEVPPEWNIEDAYVLDPQGRKIIDFQRSNLEVLGYSIPVQATVPLAELQEHLYSMPELPDAVPYVTSYYAPRWGFCLPHRERERLEDGDYTVAIASRLEPGSLTYGELILPGDSEHEVLLSTYVCHPSLANNELSGPVVTTFLAKWLAEQPRRKYTYRILFIPETIGSIAYLSLHLEHMKAHTVAGFNVTCVGDDRAYSFLPSCQGDTLADQAGRHALGHLHPGYKSYSFLERGSDERQYCSPGVDLPVCSLMRTKYACYPEYHTSLDDLRLVTPDGLYGGFDAIRHAIVCLELNETLRRTVLCEPQLGKRGLYPTVSTRSSGIGARQMMNLLAYVDGRRSLLTIADLIDVPLWQLTDTVQCLKDAGVLEPA